MMKHSEITSAVIEAAIRIHRDTGPGLLESVYQTILAHELGRAGWRCETQCPIPLAYDTLIIPDAFRADIIVNRTVILELKSVEELHRVHIKQLQTYLRLSGLAVGLLINFNVPLLKDGITRFVSNPDKPGPPTKETEPFP